MTFWFRFMLVLFVGTAEARDWPGYRGGRERRAFSPEAFPQKLKPAWTVSLQAPSPAWPAPAKKSYWQKLETITARVTDDQACHPVIANGFVLVASSADDHLYCYRLKTGEQVWRFGTDGPIRYAPYVADGSVFLGSDDGVAYCVKLDTGKEVWRRRLADEDVRIPGNGRIVSSWPIRTGCLTHGRRVFFTSGLYPQQGTWVWSLDSATGDIGWRTKLDVSPQGYLLASESQLFVPTGRGQPISLDLATGTHRSQLQSLGGTFAVVDSGVLLSGPGNDGSLSLSDTRSGNRLSSVRGEHLSVGDQYSFLIEAGELIRLDRGQFLEATRARSRWTNRLLALQAERKKLPASGAEKLANSQELKLAADSLRQAEDRLTGARRVLSKTETIFSLLGLSDAVLAGQEDKLIAFSSETGQIVWEVSIEGRAVGLALSESHLVVTTSSGTLMCFAPESHLEAQPVRAESVSESETQNGPQTLLPLEISKDVPLKKGFAVFVGRRASRCVEEITEETDLKCVVFLTQNSEVQAERTRWMDRGMYGKRVSVLLLEDSVLPMAGDVAALVIYESTNLSGEEAQRVARPHGGIALDLEAGAVVRRGALPGEGRWTHLYGNPANTASSGDRWASSDLSLQWFGGVGPSRMVDRHLRGSAPLYDGGIMVVPGENVVLGVDAYTGEELWELSLPDSQRYSMPYDAGYMALEGQTFAVAVGRECWIVNSVKGTVRARLPLSKQAQEACWGYVGFRDPSRLIGTWQAHHASRMHPSRDRVDADYRDGQALVCGLGIFSVDIESGALVWSRPSTGIVNPTLTVTKDSVHFVEFMGDDEIMRNGRMALESIVEREPQLAAVGGADGQTKWRAPLPESALRCRNILYLTHAHERLILVGSYLNSRKDTTYEVLCFSAIDGSLLWSRSHDKGKPGETYHGEQMHHPVIVGDYLVTEPVVYHLETGEPVAASGQENAWRLSRPGHSCGTISASQNSLYFRAGNPTALDLSSHLMGRSTPKKLAPTRPGCWINIIPAGGMVLIPEASAGCVCDFSLQTSMAFRPR